MIKKLFIPFKTIIGKQRTTANVVLFLLIAVVWQSSGSRYIPPPSEVFGSLPTLMDKDLVPAFVGSIWLCMKTMSWSVLISVTFCYASVLPAFRGLCEFCRKFRFLPSVGLTFLFMKVAPDLDTMAEYMMVFGITSWLLDSMVGVALDIGPEEVMYARSLRLSRWQTMREVLIYGKAAQLFNAIISNFAMAWMLLAAVENIVKSNGGIGVLLAESNKYYRFEQLYMVLILILVTGILIDWALRGIRDVLFPYYNIKN